MEGKKGGFFGGFIEKILGMISENSFSFRSGDEDFSKNALRDLIEKLDNETKGKYFKDFQALKRDEESKFAEYLALNEITNFPNSVDDMLAGDNFVGKCTNNQAFIFMKFFNRDFQDKKATVEVKYP